jgi:ribonucleoside-diphosphate reductase alpha chain
MVTGHDNIKMATSVIDYIFRELGLSYLGRTDLVQVKPEDIYAGSVTQGEPEQRVELAGSNDMESSGNIHSVKYLPGKHGRRKSMSVSKGLTMSGLATQHRQSNSEISAVTIDGGRDFVKARRTVKVSNGTKDTLTVKAALEERAVAETHALAETIQIARLKGYEGDPCSDCGNFTLVRNGSCLKCATCGATTGCS